MTLEIPDAVVERGTAADLIVEFAIGLYVAERMSLAKAAEVAGLDRISFSKVLASREIPTMYAGIEDLEQELRQLRALGEV